MRILTLKSILALLVGMMLAFAGCYETETLNKPVKDNDAKLMTELDQYIEANFTQKYGVINSWIIEN